MNFTSSIFIFIFMPGFFALYFVLSLLTAHSAVLRKLRLKDVLTVACSFVFYMWACSTDLFFLLALIIGGYLGGVIIGCLSKYSLKGLISKIASAFEKTSVALIVLIAGIVCLVSILYKFKYEGQLSFSFYDFSNMTMPLGISFLTFSMLSYWIDVYKGVDKGNFLDVALYISFFPKVISGPIVLWEDFREKLKDRCITVDRVKDGICKIVIGLAKKVIIADYFGTTLQTIQNNSGGVIDTLTAWLICLLYMQQIYFDFAGYSDVAIGLSKIIGNDIEENFNFPYISTSITEFWKRWHISLGTWFRKYIYIPLGGNRKGKKRTLFNVFAVMFISGIWHGAGLGYLVWGICHGLCMVCERCVNDKSWYKRVPHWLKWLVTMFIVMMGWQVFRLGSFSEAVKFYGILLGSVNSGVLTFSFQYYLTRKLIIMLLLSVFGAVCLYRLKSLKVYQRYRNTVLFTVFRDVLTLALFIIVIMCVVNSTYSPFIYFQY